MKQFITVKLDHHYAELGITVTLFCLSIFIAIIQLLKKGSWWLGQKYYLTSSVIFWVFKFYMFRPFAWEIFSQRSKFTVHLFYSCATSEHSEDEYMTTMYWVIYWRPTSDGRLTSHLENFKCGISATGYLIQFLFGSRYGFRVRQIGCCYFWLHQIQWKWCVRSNYIGHNLVEYVSIWANMKMIKWLQNYQSINFIWCIRDGVIVVIRVKVSIPWGITGTWPPTRNG